MRWIACTDTHDSLHTFFQPANRCFPPPPCRDYWKSSAFFGAILLFYLLFSLPMSYIKHSRVDRTAADDVT